MRFWCVMSMQILIRWNHQTSNRLAFHPHPETHVARSKFSTQPLTTPAPPPPTQPSVPLLIIPSPPGKPGTTHRPATPRRRWRRSPPSLPLPAEPTRTKSPHGWPSRTTPRPPQHHRHPRPASPPK